MADFIWEKHNGFSYGVEVVRDTHVIAGALRASRPELFKDRHNIPIDCRSLNDPQATKHIGLHPNILDACSNQRGVEAIAKSIGYSARVVPGGAQTAA